MITPAEFDSLLFKRKALVIDGGLATELENRGHDLQHALWSGKVLKESPGTIREVHRDYFVAGADIAITASYQTSTQGLMEQFKLSNNEANALIHQSVCLAQQAREDAYAIGSASDRKLLVAGSVGPYGAYLADGSEYTGTYDSISKKELQEFHRPRIQSLIEAGTDLLAIETMPQMLEISAILDLLATEFKDVVAWISCTLKDSQHISDGTSFATLMEVVARHNQAKRQILACGVNCVSPRTACQALSHLCFLQQGQQSHRPSFDIALLCYPNSGEAWNARSNTWSGDGPSKIDVRQEVRAMKDAGAKLIGGCCRNGPDYIVEVVNVLEDVNCT